MKKNSKNKKPNLSKSELRLAKISSPYQQLKERLSWREKGIGQHLIEEICDAYLDWVQLEDSIDPIDFRHKFGIPKTTWRELKKKYDMLELVDEMVHEKVGTRRQKLAMYKKYECNPQVIMETIGMYHPTFKEYEELRHQRQKEIKLAEAEDKPTHVTVVMEDYGKNKKK